MIVFSHHSNCFPRIPSHGSFLGEHDAVRPIQYGVSHISSLSAGGAVMIYHRFKHMCGGDHRSAQQICLANNVFLRDRDPLHGSLDTQIAASDHDPVGALKNRVQVVHSARTFDFGDDKGRIIHSRRRLAHGRGLDVWFHSWGNIAALIPHWIDIGLDVISPLQAAAMDLPAVAAAYHGQITFFGGIDVQHNLVHGTRASIREEVRSLLRMFHAQEGRYMASPCNTIMPETPVENVWALFEAIRELGGGRRTAHP